MQKIAMRILYLFLLLTLLVSNTQVSAAPTAAQLSAASGTVSLEPVGRIGGVSMAIAVQGNYAYVGQGVFMLVFDVSNPSQPQQIAKLDLSGSEATGIVDDIQIVNGWAYIAYGRGLKIVKLTNPAVPVLVGSLSVPRWAMGVVVQGNYAYLAEAETGIRVINIASPASPQSVATFDTPGVAWKVEIVGTTLYVADQSGGLRIVSVANPLHPVEVGAFQPAGIFTSNVAVSGNTAFVVDRGDINQNRGLRVVNIADPAHPVQTKFFPINWANDIIVSGNLAYLVSSDTIYTYNILDPSNPVQISTTPTKMDNNAVALQGNRLYLTSWVIPLQIFDISTPAQLVTLNTPTRTSFPVSEVAVVGNRAYAAGWHYGGVQIIDVADPANPNILGIYHPDEPIFYPGLAVSDNIIYLISNKPPKLILIDASDPANLTPISQINIPGASNRVKVAGGYAYVAAGDQGLVIFDVSDPYAPVQVGAIDSPAEASDLEVIWPYVYLADGSGGLRVINVSTPANPVDVSAYVSNAQINGLAAFGSTVYLAADTNGLEVIDVSDPAHPIKIGELSTDGPVRDVALQGNVAYVADPWVGLVAVDVSNPAAPVKLASGSSTAYIQTMTPAGGYVYVADRENGLAIVKTIHSPAYSLSGRVQLANSQPLAGVTLTNGAGYSLTSAANGQFSFTGLPGGGYTIRPVKLGYTFSPAEINLTLSGNLGGRNFTATQQLYSVSGKVFGRDGQALAGATISAASGQTALSGADGSYTIGNLPAGTVTLTAGGNGYTLSPNSLTLRVLSNRTGVNFTSQIEGGQVGQVGGMGYVMSREIQNNLLLVGVGPRTLILDITDRLHPVTLWQSDPVGTSGWINGAAREGNRLYVMQSNGKTAIYNINDPVHPALLGTINHSTFSIVVKNNLAYFADKNNGIIITNVNDPAHPVDISTLTLKGGAVDVSLAGSRAYVASCYGQSLYTVDLTDLAQPQIVDTISLNGCPAQGMISGGYLYQPLSMALSSGQSGLHIFNLANPDHPVEIGSLPTPEHDVDLTIQGNIVYLGSREGGLRVINVADPAHPVQVGLLDTAGIVGGSAAIDHYVYVSDYFDGVRIVDVADPSHPVEVGAFNPGAGNSRRANLVGGTLYLANGINGLEIFDVSDVFHPVLVGRYNTPGLAADVQVNGHYVFVADENGGLQIVDISDPAHPVLAGSVGTAGTAKAVAFANNYVFLAASGGGLQVVSVADPAHPLLAGTLSGIGNVSGITVAGDRVYLAGDLGLTIASLADPAHPQLISSLATGAVIRVDLYLNYAYLSGLDNILRIVDVSDALHPHLVGNLALGGQWINAQNITGHSLYLNQYPVGNQVYSLADPLHPTLAGNLPGAKNASDLAAGCYTMYTFSSSGIEINHTNLCEQGDPVAPVQLQLDQPVVGVVTGLTSQVYRFTATAGQPLSFVVTPANPADQLAIYLRFENMPDWIHHDLRSFEKTPSGSYIIGLPAAQAGNYYLAVYGQSLPAGSGRYTVVVHSVARQLTYVTPRQASNTGMVTLTLGGLGFTAGMNVELRAAGKPTLSAQAVTIVSSTQISALFNLSGTAQVVYNLAAIFPDGGELILTKSFVIQGGLGQKLMAQFRLLPQVRPGHEYMLVLYFKNTGGANLTMPVLTVTSSDQTTLSMVTGGPYRYALQISSPSFLPDLLPPGASGYVVTYFKVPTNLAPRTKVCFKLTIPDSNGPRQLDLACTEVIASLDPNKKVGPVGNGIFNTVRNDSTLSYTIFFENQASATAPAQEVFITDTLDPAFDWTSFQIGEIRFGNQTVIPQQMAAGLYYARLEVPDYRNGATKTWWVDISAQINLQTGQILWTLRTLDPLSGDLPEDALAGFLPPNDATQRGEGYVTFSIGLNPDLKFGQWIKNQANITFDTNAPIATNWVANTVSPSGQLPAIFIPAVSR